MAMRCRTARKVAAALLFTFPYIQCLQVPSQLHSSGLLCRCCSLFSQRCHTISKTSPGNCRSYWTVFIYPTQANFLDQIFSHSQVQPRPHESCPSLMKGPQYTGMQDTQGRGCRKSRELSLACFRTAGRLLQPRKGCGGSGVPRSLLKHREIL